MFHILHPLSHHIHFRARTQPRASHERAGTWMILGILGRSNHRNPLVRQPPIQKNNLNLCKSQKHVKTYWNRFRIIYLFTWKIMKVRIVTTQNLSATQAFFFPGRFKSAVVSAPRHIAVFVDFHPRGFHFGFLQKPGDGGESQVETCSGPISVRHRAPSTSLVETMRYHEILNMDPQFDDLRSVFCSQSYYKNRITQKPPDLEVQSEAKPPYLAEIESPWEEKHRCFQLGRV